MRYLQLCAIVLILIMAPVSLKAEDELYVVYSFERDVMAELFKRFAEAEGVNVKADYATEDVMKSTLMVIMEKRPPDVLMMPADQVGLYSLAHYSEIDHSVFKANIAKRALDCGVSDGKLYGEPLFQGNHLFLYYNKRFVKEPAKDWAAMLAQKKEFDSKKITTIVWPFNEPYYLLPFLSAYGGWPLVDGNVQLNTPAMVAALDYYHGLQTQKLINPPCDLACTGDLFKARKAAYVLGGIWDAHRFHDALGEDLGVTAMPLVEGKKMLSPFSTYIMAFPNDGMQSSKREALIKLVNYFQSTAIQKELWDRVGTIPVEAAAFEYAQSNATPYLKSMLDLMIDTKPIPADQAMTYLWDAMRKGMLRNQVNALDAAGAALYMQNLAERHLVSLQKQAAKKNNADSSSQNSFSAASSVSAH